MPNNSETSRSEPATTEPRRKLFRFSPQHRVLLPLLLATVLLAFGIGAFVHFAGALASTEGEEEELSLVSLRLQEMISFVQDAESGQRAFLLTGNTVYLKSFPDDSSQIDSHIADVRKLLSDNPDALLQLDVVDTFRKRAFTDFEKAIALKRQGRAAAAMAIVESGHGEYYMRQIRDSLAEVMKIVRAEQSEINARVATRIRHARYSLFGLALIVIVVLGVSYAIVLVTFRKNQHLSEMLEQEATHDVLSGLPNRRYFESWMKFALAQAVRDGTKVAVFFMDLDGFKQINDRLGHEVGDAVLISAAKCFTKTLRQADLLARLGGDEFVVLVPKAGDSAGLAVLAERLGRSLSMGMDVAIGDLAVGASIGIAVFPDDAKNVESLLQKADEAMYQVKQNGKGGYAFAGATGGPKVIQWTVAPGLALSGRA
jgi:diguanylate cyclase (GGDEF)-like protein